MERSTIYSLKIWGFTIFTPSILLIFFLFGSDFTTLLTTFLSIIFLNILVSSPFFAVFKIVTDFIFEKEPDGNLAKLYINVVGLIACNIPILIYSSIVGDLYSLIWVMIIHSVCLSMAIWIFDLKRNKIKITRTDIIDDNFNH